MADDLLQCDCLDRSAQALKEKDLNLADLDDGSDDEQKRGFVPAAQYSAAPVSDIEYLTKIGQHADQQTKKMLQKVSRRPL